eukprot:933756-Amphidinium_carterae.1
MITQTQHCGEKVTSPALLRATTNIAIAITITIVIVVGVAVVPVVVHLLVEMFVIIDYCVHH